MEKTSIFTQYTLKPLGRGWPMDNLLRWGGSISSPRAPNLKTPPPPAYSHSHCWSKSPFLSFGPHGNWKMSKRLEEIVIWVLLESEGKQLVVPVTPGHSVLKTCPVPKSNEPPSQGGPGPSCPFDLQECPLHCAGGGSPS